MDHNEAVRLQAAEKYLLRELPAAQLEEYEQHYFDCPACAEDLKTAVAFMESTRQVLRDGPLHPSDAKGLTPSTGGWFAWLRPAFAVPVCAALLLFIGYQNGVTIPSLKQSSSQPAAPEVISHFSLVPKSARGEGASASAVKVAPHQNFDLDMDMPGNSPTGYICLIRDSSGRTLYTIPVSSEAAKNGIELRMPGGSLPSGSYSLLVFVGPSEGAQPSFATATSEMPFTVEFDR